MLARLILVLLLAAFAVPAAAASGCHESTPTHHTMPGMPDVPEHKSDPGLVTAHVCIGCIPPGDWISTPVEAPRAGREVPAVTAIVRFDIGLSAPPALPPPRGV